MVTCADGKSRNSARALEMAKKAVALSPTESYWLTLGWACYRTGNWKAALEAAEKAMPLRNGGDCADWFLLAMVHWKLGDKEEARRWYQRADRWMEKNSHPDWPHPDWPHFHTEAAALLDIQEQPAKEKEKTKAKAPSP